MRANRSRCAGVLLCVLIAPMLSACDEKAQEFALRTAEILQQRSAELTRKIAAERKAYQAVSTSANENQRALIESSLNNERSARAIALAADYDEGRKPPSRWQTDLAEYAAIENRINRDLLTLDLGAGAEFMQKLTALEIEQAKVDALAKLLAALAKKPSLADDITAISAFAEDTKNEFDKKVCEALAKDASAAGQAAFKAKGCKK
jgi:hypothetical protein